MKKGSLVLLIALSALLVVFSDQVTGQWAGIPGMPNGKRGSSFDDVSNNDDDDVDDEHKKIEQEIKVVVLF